MRVRLSPGRLGWPVAGQGGREPGGQRGGEIDGQGPQRQGRGLEPGIVRAVVPVSDARTVYAAVGDWVPLVGFLAYVALRLWPPVGRRLVAAVVRRVRVATDVPADRRAAVRG